MGRVGSVFYNKVHCGYLKEVDGGFTFVYDEDWLTNPNAHAISLTMPLQKEPYFSEVLFPFFDGLCPEGYLLELTLQKWGVKRNDRMGVLFKSCSNPIGAVSVEEESND